VTSARRTGSAAARTASDYRISSGTLVPLEGLTGTDQVFTFVVDETLSGDANGDGDSVDSIVTLRDPGDRPGDSDREQRAKAVPWRAFGTALSAIRRSPPRAASWRSSRTRRPSSTRMRMATATPATPCCAPSGARARVQSKLTSGGVVAADVSPRIRGGASRLSGGRVFFHWPEAAGADYTLEDLTPVLVPPIIIGRFARFPTTGDTG
jgi:hypothetical protein